MNILFVNACVREESRTAVLSRRVLSHLTKQHSDSSISEVNLNDEKVMPLDRDLLEKRNGLQSQGDFSDPMFDYVRQFADADIIVMASPYWDLSIAACLKAYIEAIQVIGVTFAYDETDCPYGMCRGKQLYFVTTAGGEIFSDEYGFGYIKKVAEVFWQIPEIVQFKAEKLDLVNSDTEQIMANALHEIDCWFN